MNKRIGRSNYINDIRLRRTMKSRTRDNMWCNNDLTYLKLLLIWFSILIIDLNLGFRVELFYPILSGCRCLFEQGALGSFSLHAFVMFMCAMVVADVVCYFVVPMQLLLFMGSSCVLLHLLCRTGRCIGTIHVLLSVILIAFDYNWRYRGDSIFFLFRGTFVHYLSNSLFDEKILSYFSLKQFFDNSWISETSVFVDTTSSFRIGSFLAVNCIAYPFISLIRDILSQIRNWRIEKQRKNVRNANSVFIRLISAALPSSILNDSIEDGGTLPEDISVTENEMDIMVAQKNDSFIATQSVNMNSARKNIPCSNGTRKFHLHPSCAHAISRKNVADDSERHSSASDVSHSTGLYLLRFLWYIIKFIPSYVLIFDAGFNTADDHLSLLSNEVDSDANSIERIEVYQNNGCNWVQNASNRAAWGVRNSITKKLKGCVSGDSKARTTTSRRSRGRAQRENYASTPTASVSDSLAHGSCYQSSTVCSATERNSLLLLKGLDAEKMECHGNSDINLSYSDSLLASENRVMREELQVLRTKNAELRGQHQQIVNSEKCLRSSLSQCKEKLTESESKLQTGVKLREQDKAKADRRVADIMTRKNELEVSLSVEKRQTQRLSEELAKAQANVHSARIAECGEPCKGKKNELEIKIRSLEKKLLLKEKHFETIDQQLRDHKGKNMDLHKQLEICLQKIDELSEALKGENRLKQQLFINVSDKGIRITDLEKQLFAKEQEVAKLERIITVRANDRNRDMERLEFAVHNNIPSIACLPHLQTATSPFSSVGSSVDEHNRAVCDVNEVFSSASNCFTSFGFHEPQRPFPDLPYFESLSSSAYNTRVITSSASASPTLSVISGSGSDTLRYTDFGSKGPLSTSNTIRST